MGAVISDLLKMPDTACAIRKGAVWWLRRRIREGEHQTVLLAVTSPDKL